MTKIKKLVLNLTAATAVGASSANAAVVWDFNDQPLSPPG